MTCSRPRASPPSSAAIGSSRKRLICHRISARKFSITSGKKWPEPIRSQAEKANPEERRKLAFSRYGLTPRPEDPTKPLQYIVDAAGNWTMNCFACHGGKIEGQAWPGLPNSHYALATLTEETRSLKLDQGKPLGRASRRGQASFPLIMKPEPFPVCVCQSHDALVTLCEANTVECQDFAHLQKEPDLAPLRDLPEFEMLLRQPEK